MTPEGVVKKKIKKVLAKFDNLDYSCPVQNGMGTPMLDFHCCVSGHYMAIEAKSETGVVSPRQQITIDRLRNAGAAVFIIRDEAGVVMLEEWLRDRAPYKASART